MTQTRRWVIGTALAVVVILAAGWFLLAKPQKAKVANLHAQAASEDQANALLLTQISALQAEQKQLPQQQLILQKFSTEVPDTAAEPTLIRQLSSAANGAGVDLSSITPGGPAAVSAAPASGAQGLSSTAAPSSALYQLPLSLAVSGTYANIESFFNSLERLPRALLVNSFSLAAGSGGTATGKATSGNALTASLSAAVFFAPGTTAPPPIVSTPQPAASTSPAPAAPVAPASNPGVASPPAAAVPHPTYHSVTAN